MRLLEIHVNGLERIYKKPDLPICKINIHEYAVLFH